MPAQKLTTIFVLITVICLGLSVLLMPSRESREVTPEPLVAFPPSEVAEVTFAGSDAGADAQRLVRVAADRWELRLGTDPEVRWPVSPDRVRAFLRILDRLRGIPAESPEEGTSATLRVTTAAGEQVTLGLPSGSLGGRAVMTVGSEGRAFVTTDELLQLLSGRGFLAWIDARAFAGLDGRVKQIEIRSGGGSMVLTSANGGWTIEAPFTTAAEGSLVAELLQGLQMLPVAEARAEVSEPPTDATTITLTTESRGAQESGEVTLQTTTHKLVTLGPVSGGGRIPVLLRAQAEDTGAGLAAMVEDEVRTTTLGPLTASVDAGAMTELVRQPAFYIARRAMRAEPGDLRALVVTLPAGGSVRVEREGAGWTRDGQPVNSAEASMIESLAELLTVGVASVAGWSEDGTAPGSNMLATIECEGFGGVTLETVGFGVARLPAPATDERLHALLTVGNVARYYTPEGVVGGAATWITGLRPATPGELGPGTQGAGEGDDANTDGPNS